MPSFLRCFSEEWLTIRLCSKCVDILEKRKEYAEAISMLNCILAQSLFCQSNRGALYERLAIDYERYIKNPKMVRGFFCWYSQLDSGYWCKGPWRGQCEVSSGKRNAFFSVVVVDLVSPVRGRFFSKVLCFH